MTTDVVFRKPVPLVVFSTTGRCSVTSEELLCKTGFFFFFSSSLASLSCTRRVKTEFSDSWSTSGSALAASLAGPRRAPPVVASELDGREFCDWKSNIFLGAPPTSFRDFPRA